ncbi:MAG: alanine racemase [Rhodospirillaceae bacterium]
MTGVPERLAGAVLTVDLDAIAANYRTLLNKLGGVPAGAVVKANAYGLGVERVAPTLAAAGCTHFFVAHLSEGLHLRGLLPDAEICILNGLLLGAEDVYAEHNLVPALNDIRQIDAWKTFCGDAPRPCDVHVDTGMLRLGLPPSELAILADEPDRVAGLDVRFVITHLASADEPESDQSARQLAAYRRAREILPMGRACVPASSAIFLGPDYHFDMARAGVALYGANPTPGRPNPMANVVTLKARIFQLRDAHPGETVGYGATYRVDKPAMIATLPVGYADGYLRSLSNVGTGMIDGVPVPLVGRVSMDLITLEVSNVPDAKRQPGQWVELIGPANPVDAVADAAGTIGYEILTSLGSRYHRHYVGGPA